MDVSLLKELHTNPAPVPTASTCHMVTSLRLVCHDAAHRAPLDIVGLGPFIAQAVLFSRVPLESPLLTGHSFMRLLVTGRADAGEASRTLVDLLAGITLIDLGTVRGGAIPELFRVSQEVRGKNGIDEDIEPLLCEIALDDGY